MASLSILANETYLWPNPWEMVLAGEKLHLVQDLHEIGMLTGNPTPVTVEIDDPLDARFSQLVIKRSFSDCGRHVILPKTTAKGKKREKAIKTMVKETQQFYGQQEWVRPRFFGVPYMEEYARLGEIRFLTIGGEFIHAVVTTAMRSGRATEPNQFEVREVLTIMPLNMLQ